MQNTNAKDACSESQLTVLFGSKYRPQEHKCEYSTAGELTGMKEQLRKLLRIPSTKDFPYSFADSFEPASVNVGVDMYSRNPITHTVSRYVTGRDTGLQTKSETPLRELGDLDYRARHGQYRRQKGVVQWVDINAPSFPRARPEIVDAMEKDPDTFKLKVSSLSSPIQPR